MTAACNKDMINNIHRWQLFLIGCCKTMHKQYQLFHGKKTAFFPFFHLIFPFQLLSVFIPFRFVSFLFCFENWNDTLWTVELSLITILLVCYHEFCVLNCFDYILISGICGMQWKLITTVSIQWKKRFNENKVIGNHLNCWREKEREDIAFIKMLKFNLIIVYLITYFHLYVFSNFPF